MVTRLNAPDSINTNGARGWRNAGARACAVAHQLAWRKMISEELDFILVFEDDVILCENFRQRLESLNLPEDWTICYFGCVFRDLPVPLSPTILKVTGRTWDMHAYLIRHSFAKKVALTLRQFSRKALDGNVESKDRKAIDVIMAQHHATHPAYAVWPPMAWQTTGLSNNENSVRGNYRADGTQNIFREFIRHLPGVT